ncbi:hypothetical protein V6N13_146947 [Hibiscus sabdariffa]|uniref:Uncharacterized protein n=1 Tax=Hibiscus sabdariffa TaxID=183260 RepID=A0ABR2TUC5_9ROSI
MVTPRPDKSPGAHTISVALTLPPLRFPLFLSQSKGRENVKLRRIFYKAYRFLYHKTLETVRSINPRKLRRRLLLPPLRFVHATLNFPQWNGR